MALAGLAAPGAPVRSMDAPLGAYQDASQVPALLQEHPALLLELPHLAMRHPPALYALGARVLSTRIPTYTTPTVPALVRAGAFRAFASSRPDLDGNGRFAQVGAATRAGDARVGVTLGMAESVSERSQLQTDAVTAVSSHDWTQSRLVEGSAGGGFGWGTTTVDVVVGLRWRDDEKMYSSSQSSSEQSTTTDDTPRGWVVLRAAREVGESTRVTAVGAYANDGRSTYWRVLSPTVDFALRVEDPASTWRAGLAGEFEVSSVGQLTVWAAFDQARTSTTSAYVTSDLRSTASTRTTNSRAGAALSYPFTERTTGLLGFAGSYLRQHREYHTTAPAARRSVDRSDADSFEDRFSWGLSHTQGRVTVLGAMNTRLSFEQLFASLDVQVAL